MTQRKLAALRYVHVFRCTRLVSSDWTRSASNCWIELLQCDRHSDRSDALALRARMVQYHSASGWPSECPCNAFAVLRENVHLLPNRCRRRSSAICYQPCTPRGQSSPAKLSLNQECLDTGHVTNLEQLSVWLPVLPSDMCQAAHRRQRLWNCSICLT